MREIISVDVLSVARGWIHAGGRIRACARRRGTPPRNDGRSHRRLAPRPGGRITLSSPRSTARLAHVAESVMFFDGENGRDSQTVERAPQPVARRKRGRLPTWTGRGRPSGHRYMWTTPSISGTKGSICRVSVFLETKSATALSPAYVERGKPAGARIIGARGRPRFLEAVKKGRSRSRGIR